MPTGLRQQLVQVVEVDAVVVTHLVNRDLVVDAISLRTDVDALNKVDVPSAKRF